DLSTPFDPLPPAILWPFSRRVDWPLQSQRCSPRWNLLVIVMNVVCSSPLVAGRKRFRQTNKAAAIYNHSTSFIFRPFFRRLNSTKGEMRMPGRRNLNRFFSIVMECEPYQKGPSLQCFEDFPTETKILTFCGRRVAINRRHRSEKNADA